jgi:hypothetical protein
MGIAEINQHEPAAKIAVGDCFACTVHQRERAADRNPANGRRIARCLPGHARQ